MLNKKLIMTRISMLRNSVNRLVVFNKLTEAEFLAESDNYAIAEHHLRRALESLFDIGRHVMAKKALGHPEDYRSIIEALGQNKVIPKSFTQEIMGMAGYRNRLVPGYAEVTAKEIYQIIQTRLADFEAFVGYLLQYLEKDHLDM